MGKTLVFHIFRFPIYFLLSMRRQFSGLVVFTESGQVYLGQGSYLVSVQGPAVLLHEIGLLNYSVLFIISQCFKDFSYIGGDYIHKIIFDLAVGYRGLYIPSKIQF